ncbi:MAG: hypothetical protein A2068_06690, partial [Ignavibacteria bacterium GWB2_35_6b]
MKLSIKKSPKYRGKVSNGISGKGILELELQRSILNHENGNLEEAEKGYLELIKENPEDGKLNFLLGTLYLQGGKPDVSSVFLGKSISKNPSNTKAINNLGLAYQTMGRYEDAIKLFNAALKVDENYLSAYNNLGICYQLTGDFKKAVEVLKTSLSINKNDSETNYNLGTVLHKQGFADEALTYYLTAVELNPEYAEAFYNIALIKIDNKEFETAKLYLENAIEILPGNFDILFNLGFVNEQLKNFDLAEKYYKSALEINPFTAELNFNLGNIYKERKVWDKAEEYYLNALKYKNDAKIFTNLGFVRHKQSRYDEAKENYKAALNIDKNYTEAKINLGASLLELGKIDDAIQEYNEVLKTNNEDAAAHFNKSVALLLSGKFEEGWKEYEWRFKKGNLAKPEFVKPEWNGENLSGKTILVHDEQGIGDSIQFVRFLKLLKEQNAKVIFKCRRELINLYKNFESIDEFVELTNKVKSSFDFEISLLSLPRILKTNLINIPTPNETLKIDNTLSEYWKNKLSGNEKLKIGLVWKGNPEHEYDYKRSCRLSDLKNFLKNENAEYYSLQKENDKEELQNYGVIDLSKEFSALENTAACITNMDLIITVDTAAAHIAGALGKETWVLLSKIPDWRWLLERNDSPWYPSVKLFRQKENGNWETIAGEIKSELNKIFVEGDEELIKEFLNKKIQAFQYHVNGETEKAEKLYLELLNIFNDDSELCFWLASLCSSKKNYSSSVKYYEQALLINPNYFEAAEALAFSYEQLKDYKSAVKNYEKVLTHQKNDFALLFKTGDLYGRLRNFETAEKYLQAAYQLNPNDFDLLNIYGLVLQKKNKLSEAREIFFKAEEMSPLTAGIYLNIGNTYLYERKFEDALRNYNEACKLNANFKDAHIAKGITLLLNENYELGWKEFVWGLNKPAGISKNNTIPIWKPLSGKGETVLVYSEQGAGDVIQFLRYLPLIKELDYKIIFECPESLYALFNNVEFIDEIITKENSDYSKLSYNYYVPLLSLPGIFNTNTHNIPPCQGLLNVADDETDVVKIDRSKINIGFAWAGNPHNGNDHNRSTRLKYFTKLFKNNSIEFYSLQKDGAEESEEIFKTYKNVHDLSQYLNDFSSTAKIINQLDLVITVETGIAHLAGTLGKPVWTLLAYLPDWRWLLDRDDSPWYSSMKLFRQNKPGDWESVFEKLKNEFPVWAEEKSNNKYRSENFETQIEEQKIHARKLLDENKIEEAKTLLQNILKTERSSNAYFDLGYCFHLQNNLPAALENYNKTLELEPYDFNALNNIGIILKDLQKFDEAANSLLLSL